MDDVLQATRSRASGRRGTTGWIAQRASGAVMSIFVLVLISRVAVSDKTGRDAWAWAIDPHWMRQLVFVTILALGYHAWAGMRDVLMDYVKLIALRLVLHSAIAIWLLGCAGWAIRVLWRI